MNSESYSVTRIAKEFGMTNQTIQFYTNEKLVIPDIQNNLGRGGSFRYSKKNLVELLIIKSLARMGLNLAAIKRILNKLRTSKAKINLGYVCQKCFDKQMIYPLLIISNVGSNPTVSLDLINDPFIFNTKWDNMLIIYLREILTQVYGD